MRILGESKSKILILSFFILSTFCYGYNRPLPEPFHGFVRTIIDGDTVKVEDSNKLYTIRIAYIDAPEIYQEYGRESRRCLQRLIYRDHVFVRPLYFDRYGRIVATLDLDKLPVHKLMIELGCAWHVYRYSQSDQLELLHEDTKKQKKGLWSRKNPINPATFRRYFYKY